MKRKRQFEWNELIWSSVSGKAQTMRYILAVKNIFIFSKHVLEQKRWFIWKELFDSYPRDRLREFIAAIFHNLMKTFRHICATSDTRDYCGNLMETSDI